MTRLSQQRSARAAQFRISLLAVLGLSPLACAGSSESTASGGGSAGQGELVPLDDNGQVTCSDPFEDDSTLVRCSEGYRHRPQAKGCGAPAGAAPAPGTGGTGNIVAPGTCFADEHCQADQVCLCFGVSSGTCFDATCRTDSDCGEQELCTDNFVVGSSGCGPILQFSGLACSRPRLPASGGSGGSVACGRPFLVDATARVAPSQSSSAWLDSVPQPLLAHLTSVERAELAAHWTKLGQMEHASIAAFARFSLQLLSLGAPPELIDDCTRALADETAHTKLCFALASAYAGHAIGPGPLDMTGSLTATTLTDIVDLVLLEGCLGESSAALEALEAAANAQDPVIADAYARIARDEERHAALAFRFVRWALEREPRAVKQRILEMRRSAPMQHSSVRDVVVPCLDALLDPARVSSTQELFT